MNDTPQAPSESEAPGSTPASTSSSRPLEKRRRTDEHQQHIPLLMKTNSGSTSHGQDHVPSPNTFFSHQAPSLPTTFDSSPGPLPPPNGVTLPPIWQSHLPSPWEPSPRPAASPPKPTDDTGHRRFPLEDVQEACLMRYYVEEIGHWVSMYNVFP